MSQDDLVELLTTPDSEGRTPLLRTVGSEKGPELATALLSTVQDEDSRVTIIMQVGEDGFSALMNSVHTANGDKFATALLSTVQDEGNRVAIIKQPNPYSYTTLMLVIENFSGGGEKLAIAVLMTVSKARREEILRQPNNNKDSVLLQTIDFSVEREEYFDALLSTLFED